MVYGIVSPFQLQLTPDLIKKTILDYLISSTGCISVPVILHLCLPVIHYWMDFHEHLCSLYGLYSLAGV